MTAEFDLEFLRMDSILYSRMSLLLHLFGWTEVSQVKPDSNSHVELHPSPET